MVLAVREGTFESLAGSLESEGLKVLSARSGLDALSRVTRHQPRALLLDLQLCSFGSEGIIAMVHVVSPGTRIVAYSPSSAPEDAAAVESGVFFYAAGGNEAYVADALHAALAEKSIRHG
ncbi:MAG: response regulator [Planctomycetes bacterium]|nr:response regulator [Planctomycetota bacterium]